MNLAMTILMAFGLLSAGCASSGSITTTNQTVDAKDLQQHGFTVGNRTLYPALAIDPITRQRGLQGQTPPLDGLILVFPDLDRHSLWMPNCPEPLEAWVLSNTGEILQILELPAESPQGEQESSWQYSARLPRHHAQYQTRIMWEFAAGEAQRQHVMVGDHISGPWNLLLGSAD